MATIHDWNKYINLLHEYALVEYDLREAQGNGGYYDANLLAEQILFERF